MLEQALCYHLTSVLVFQTIKKLTFQAVKLSKMCLAHPKYSRNIPIIIPYPYPNKIVKAEKSVYSPYHFLTTHVGVVTNNTLVCEKNNFYSSKMIVGTSKYGYDVKNMFTVREKVIPDYKRYR